VDLIDTRPGDGYDVHMERGTVALSNLELQVLHDFAVAQGCQQTDLLNKLTPVANISDPNQEHTVLISENDAEIILDCMPVPNDQTDSVITSARIKIQQFLAKCRFPESFVSDPL
jgi:hypothetical protein